MLLRDLNGTAEEKRRAEVGFGKFEAALDLVAVFDELILRRRGEGVKDFRL
jgi:hypothetical protein